MAAVYLGINYQKFIKANKDLKNIEFLIQTSKLREGLQKERALIYLYYFGLASQKEIRLHKRSLYKSFESWQSYHDLNLGKRESFRINLTSWRDKVISNALEQDKVNIEFNNLMIEFQEIARPIIHTINFNIEEQKELLDLFESTIYTSDAFRDQLITVLVKNMPISSPEFKKLVVLKSKTEILFNKSFIKSSTWKKDPFLASQGKLAWGEMEESFNRVVNSSEQGIFNIDIKNINKKFSLINQSLKTPLENIRKRILTKIKNRELKSRTWFLKITCLSLFFFGLMGFLLQSLHRRMLYLYVMQLRGKENVDMAPVFDFLKEKNKREDLYVDHQAGEPRADRTSESLESKKIA